MAGRAFYVYLLSNGRNGTLYCGVTNDLIRRVQEHRDGLASGFTAEHGVDILVWYETHDYIDQAILREKRIKRWRRAWKIELIESSNPHWLDLYGELVARSGLASG